MSALRDVVDAVVRIPRDLEDGRTVSFHALLMASGYAKEHAAVDVAMIEAALRAHPEFIGGWLQYSDDKRTSTGWFFRVDGRGGWEVGYVDRGVFDNVSRYQDELVACAVFIKKEIDAVRASVS